MIGGDQQMAGKRTTGRGSGKARSARTGKYVTKEYAKKNPSTTVIEKK